MTSDPAVGQPLPARHWDPLPLLSVAPAANLYATGAARLRRRGGPSGPIRPRQAAAFSAGLLVVLAAR